jgi:hypothetical protein
LSFVAFLMTHQHRSIHPNQFGLCYYDLELDMLRLKIVPN